MIPMLMLFLCCLLLGALSRVWYVGLMRAQKKMGRPAAITLEFLSMGLLAAAFTVIIFFLAGGVFMPFTLIALAAGFLAASIFI